MAERAARPRAARWGAAVAAASLVVACTSGPPDGDAPEPSVAVPDGATVYVLWAGTSDGDADLALSATVHEREGGQEAHVYLADLRVADPREERVAGPPGTVGRAGGYELTIIAIEDVDGPHDDDADGVVRELVTVAVRDVTG